MYNIIYHYIYISCAKQIYKKYKVSKIMLLHVG